MTTTTVEGGAVEQTAGDLALVAFEAMLGEGWASDLAEEVAELVRGAALATTARRARRFRELLDQGVARELLDEGPSAPEGVELVAA